MAEINDCVPGRQVRVLRAGVARVVGKTGTIVEVYGLAGQPPGRCAIWSPWMSPGMVRLD